MSTPISQVRGIGPATAAILAENGIATAEDLAGKSIGEVASIKTFSETRATRVIEDAKALLAGEPLPTAVQDEPAEKPAKMKKEKVAKKPAKEKKDTKAKEKKGKKSVKADKKKEKPKDKKSDKGKKKSKKPDKKKKK